MRRFSSAFLLLLTLGSVRLEAQTSTDIYVADKVMVHRAIIGGPSSRMIAVGHPGGFNYGFDAVHCTPVYAWFGGFIDLRGEIAGRGGKYCQVLGVKRPLGIGVVPFRVGDKDAKPQVIKFRGYRRDANSAAPTFLYEVDGTAIEHQLSSPAPDKIHMEFSFPNDTVARLFYQLDSKLHQRVEISGNLSWATPVLLEIPAGSKQATITIQLKKSAKKFKRKAPELSGATIFQNFCAACHSTDGSKLIGPSFKGFWGREQVVIRDGKPQTITVDRAYALESIMKPQAAIVKGYEMVPMADFSAVLSKPQIDKLVEHLQTLH